MKTATQSATILVDEPEQRKGQRTLVVADLTPRKMKFGT